MRFSVLVTVYNAERYVGACLDALCAQTYADFEIVVVDDGSSDGSGRICDSYAERDRRVRVLHTENRGVLLARAYAEEKARGEYLLHCDGDDLVTPDMLASFSEAIDRSHPDLIICDFSYFFGDDAPIRECFFPQDRTFGGAEREELYRLLLSSRFNTLCNKCFARSLREEAPEYDRVRDLRHGEDLLRSGYLVTAAETIEYVCGSYYLYRRGVGHSGAFERDSLRGCAAVDETLRGLLQKRVAWDDVWEALYRDLCRKQLDNYVGLLVQSKVSLSDGCSILRDGTQSPLFRDALLSENANGPKYTLLRQKRFLTLLLLGRGKRRFHA